MNGSIKHVKTCIAVNGYTQQMGADHEETFSNCKVRYASTTSIGHPMDLELVQDVKMAFVHVKLNDDNFIDQPKRFVSGSLRNKGCRLKLSMY